MRGIFQGKFDEDELLWRYFRLERFLSMLNEQRVYFASANEFCDPFEGAVEVCNDRGGSPVLDEYVAGIEDAFFQLKRLTKINCWHRASYESDAMWKLYAGEHKGVAICTRPNLLRESLRDFRLQPDYGVEELWGDAVLYVDLTQESLREKCMLERFFFKHKAFEWEKEFRLAISLRMAEENGVHVPKLGIFVEADISVLVEKIVIGSIVSENDVARIVEGANNVGLADRVEFSTLLWSPRYA
ncbi:MAG TPA: DUF2971 domain-containing protein [Desulfovibrio sp.]|jgi:hypothetical protein|nr:DUF2971 domain-containing protein [Desulfovibrio sp.]